MNTNAWHEDISEKNFVYPLGNVQYLGGNSDGLTGITNGAFTGFETYSLFGNWQKPSALVGKGYVWSLLTEAQKRAFVANPENNCYLDGDKVVQVRYRVRVLIGEDTNSMAKATVQGKAVVPSTVLFTSPVTTVDAGLYSNTSATYTYTGTNTSAISIAANVGIRNQGIYHNVYNPNGTKLASDELDCFTTTISFNSISDCFDPAKLLTASGYIGTVSGRPDGLFYDQVHESDIQDLRNSSKKVEDYNRLIRREFNKLVAGTTRGKEGEWQVQSIQIANVFSKFYYRVGQGSGTKISVESPLILPPLGRSIFTETLKGTYKYFLVHNGFVYGINYVESSQGFYIYRTNIDFQDYTDYTPDIIVGESCYIVYCTKSTRTKSNTLLHCDIIGNPTNYPTAWKQSGVFGTPLIVAEDGASLLPDGVIDLFKLSRKINAAPLSVLRSKDNGLSWSKVSSEITINSLTSHSDGYIYAGTGNGGKIFRSNDGTTWTEVLDTTESRILSLTSHSDGYIYAGTNPNGKIFRSNNGTTWTEVLDTTETEFISLTSHSDGYIYAGTNPNGKIFRSNNGTTWTEVLDTTEDKILSLTSHSDGYIYAGTEPNGKIFRSNDGTTWTEVLDTTESRILSLTSHSDGYIYAGTNPNGKIFRSNNGTTWTEVLDTTETEFISLTSHSDGYIYAGTNPNGKIFRSNNGTTWTEVLDTTEDKILSLTSHSDGYIYAGTGNGGKIFRSNDGTTWTEVLKPYSFNTTTNVIILKDEPATNLVQVFYQTHTSMAVPAVNSEFVEMGDVYATNSYAMSYLANTLINKTLEVSAPQYKDAYVKLGSYYVDRTTKKIYSGAEVSPLQHIGLSFLGTTTPTFKVVPYLTRLNGKAYLNLVFKEMKYGSYLAPTVVTAAVTTYTQNMTYKINIPGCALDGKVIKWLSTTTATAIDWSLYDVSPTGVIYLISTGVVYVNVKLYDGDSWGDDSKFNIVDNVSTTLDDNGQTVLIGQKTVELPYFIGAAE